MTDQWQVFVFSVDSISRQLQPVLRKILTDSAFAAESLNMENSPLSTSY